MGTTTTSQLVRKLTLVLLRGTEKSQSGATNRYPLRATERLACNRKGISQRGAQRGGGTTRTARTSGAQRGARVRENPSQPWKCSEKTAPNRDRSVIISSAAVVRGMAISRFRREKALASPRGIISLESRRFPLSRNYFVGRLLSSSWLIVAGAACRSTKRAFVAFLQAIYTCDKSTMRFRRASTS